MNKYGLENRHPVRQRMRRMYDAVENRMRRDHGRTCTSFVLFRRGEPECANCRKTLGEHRRSS